MGATVGLQRFFLDTAWTGVGSVLDLTPLHHQLARVLRAQPGTRIVLLDGQGRACLAEVGQIDRQRAAGRVVALLPAPPEPTVQVTLYQCALKADKLEWVWQKATELGVARLAPVVSRRAVVRPVEALAKRQERWAAIVREAAEQSHRGALPELLPPMSFDEAMRTAQGVRLLSWETAGDCPGIGAALAQTQPAAVSLLIGPEGGLDADEVETAADAGWQVVTLGPRILRAETAALAALTLVMQAAGEFGPSA
ncbi:MAG: 16S rRNA (uracil(1498)-N(3))-methyltransferase [Caldilineaceae bacterium]|nr:16S rRNA (uracil(1498)-N(3))-methyltransferase [Caldilineaceae bacterium]